MANGNDTGKGPHGNPNPLYLGQYARGCRCEECTEAKQQYAKQWAIRKREDDPHYFTKVMAKYRDTPQGKEWFKQWRKLPKTLAACVDRSRARIAERRLMLAEIKLRRGCADCGYKKHFAALDFDHVLGEKFTEVSVMGTLSVDRIMQEVAKCEVVCYRCHRVRTRARMKNGESAWVRQKCSNPSADTRKIARYRARGVVFLSEVKLKQGCKDCGYDKHSEALDFDHVRGEKLFDISQRTYYSINKLTNEIAKCDVVCANCHRIRTFERHQNAVTI